MTNDKRRNFMARRKNVLNNLPVSPTTRSLSGRAEN